MRGSLERPADGPPAGTITAGLRRAIDPSLAKPRLHPDTQIAAFTTRWGERSAIAHHPGSGAYLRLTGDEADIAVRFDGTYTVGEFVVADLRVGRSLDPVQVIDLVSALGDHGILDRAPVDAYEAIGRRLQSGYIRVAERTWAWLRKQTITLPGADAFVGAVYRAGGRLFFTIPANVVAVSALAVGLVAFVAIARRGTYALTGQVSTGTAASFLGLGLVVLFVHEMGHALAVRHAGRRIIGAGFQLFLGHPAFFIDSSDLLLAPRRARAINALAGPYAEAVVAGVVSLTVWVWPDGPFAPLLFRLAGLTYLNVLINLIPFVELDGYWLLSDLLDVPRLRHRAFAVLRYELPDRLRGRRPALDRVERWLAAFGVGATVVTVAALATAWVFWGPIITRLVSALWDGGVTGRAVLILLLVLVAGPLFHAFGRVVRTGAGALRRTIADLRFRAQTSWRVEAAEAIASLPTIAGELDEATLSDVAGRVDVRRVREGAVVVRQDDAADAFYVVKRGRFAIVERDEAGRDRVLRRADAGEAFGELALLEQRPRTATVRAETDGELFVVDAGTFQRAIAPAMTAPELAPAVRPVLEVLALAPFEHLGQRDAEVLAARGEWLRLGPDEVVVRQGDPADGFYVLAAGHAQVLTDGTSTATLGAGDHFGEIALLRDVPRTATVRTTTPVRLFRIDAEAFRTLIAHAFQRGRPADASRVATGAH